MGEPYGHLTFEERCTIAHQAGQSILQITATLDRSPSSLSRELKRNSGRQVSHRPTYAQEQAGSRRWKGARLERDAALRTLVLDGLARGWSPEQIAGRLKQQKATTTISHESIYRFIYGQIRCTNDGAWRNYLPRAK
jgi:IS30 family transposase